MVVLRPPFSAISNYKSGGAPMVKIKDFTLASKNLGEGARAPRALHISRPCSRCSIYKYCVKSTVISSTTDRRLYKLHSIWLCEIFIMYFVNCFLISLCSIVLERVSVEFGLWRGKNLPSQSLHHASGEFSLVCVTAFEPKKFAKCRSALCLWPWAELEFLFWVGQF